MQGIEQADEPVKTVPIDARSYTARSLIIATGGSHNKLGVPGEDELSGRGVSYRAVCDGNFSAGSMWMDALGHVYTDIHMRTGAPGVYATRQLGAAVGDGITAAYHDLQE